MAAAGPLLPTAQAKDLRPAGCTLEATLYGNPGSDCDGERGLQCALLLDQTETPCPPSPN